MNENEYYRALIDGVAGYGDKESYPDIRIICAILGIQYEEG